MKHLLSILLTLLCVTTATAKTSPQKVIVAYVTSSAKTLPDPHPMTHINYAFAVMNPTFNGTVVQNPELLHKIVALKKQNPKLKVVLSIGGWGAGGFSEMADNDTTRYQFVAHCKLLTKQFKLDGIDMDWEYPGSSGAGIKSTPRDTENFTKLIRELRAALGNKKLVTFASSAAAAHVDFHAVMPYLDFVNVMTYDMGRPHQAMHHSALFPGDKSRFSVSQAVEKHQQAGVPNDKIVVGMPFYAHANTTLGYSDFVDYSAIPKLFEGKKFLWDDQSQVPYIADEQGTMLCVYDNPRSLTLKCQWILQNNLRGAMYWEYSCDNAEGELRDAVYNAIIQ